MKNKLSSAPGFILALLFSVSALANDGREFRASLAEQNPGGRTPQAKDIVYRAPFDPVRARNHFPRIHRQYPKDSTSNGSLYYCSAPGQSLCIAMGGDGIVFGESVSRHEFGIDRGVFFSPDSTKIAFYRKDESKVMEFPYLDRKKCALKTVRYPMNSSVSERVDVGVYDIQTGNTAYLDLRGEFGPDRYVTNICWSPDGLELYAQVLDRAQQNMHLCRFNPLSGAYVDTILEEHSATWVEPQYPLYWIKSPCNSKGKALKSAWTGKVVYTTDARDGVQNLYLVDTRTRVVERLAAVDRYMEYAGNDGSYVYFTGPDFHPVNNFLWRVSLKTRKVENLTPQEGWHSIEMASDCRSFLDVYETLDKAPESVVRSIDGKVVEVLKSSADAVEGAAQQKWNLPAVEMGTVTSANGLDLNYYRLVKPVGFDPSRKYPLIVYVYGGPHSQMVRNSYMGGIRKWELHAAAHGFAVFVMDNRGTMRHNAEYEHAIFGRCGVCEAQDQMQAVAMLRDIPWVDKDRIGVYGWSYGGFMSLTLACGNPDIFKACVAGGPVIDWKWYEVMYGERYMGRYSEHPERFEATNLVAKAASLRARTLVIQGSMDDTVVPQNAHSFIQACIEAEVPVEYFEYPDAEHNMRNKDRVHLVEKITRFFEENL